MLPTPRRARALLRPAAARNTLVVACGSARPVGARLLPPGRRRVSRNAPPVDFAAVLHAVVRRQPLPRHAGLRARRAVVADPGRAAGGDGAVGGPRRRGGRGARAPARRTPPCSSAGAEVARLAPAEPLVVVEEHAVALVHAPSLLRRPGDVSLGRGPLPLALLRGGGPHDMLFAYGLPTA